MTLIPENKMIAPRLELRWHAKNTQWSEKVCDYNLVIPLGEYDIRREATKCGFQTVKLGSTKCEGGGYPVDEARQEIEMPFRDGSHASWDSKTLKLPAYVVCDGYAMLIPE